MTTRLFDVLRDSQILGPSLSKESLRVFPRISSSTHSSSPFPVLMSVAVEHVRVRLAASNPTAYVWSGAIPIADG